MNEPTERDWAALYKAAIDFKEAAPWDRVDNEQVFAVEDHRNGENGFCCILGSGGEEFGLGVYIGAEGYRGYRKIVSGKAPETFLGVEFPVLTMLFVGRNILSKRDIEVVHSLNLRFRGRNAWPFFRSQLPGYAPWYLEQAEAVYLEEVIRQSLEVADRVRKGELNLSERTEDGLVLTRLCRDGVWKDEWQSPESDHTTRVKAPGQEVDESKLVRLREALGDASGAWELDVFPMPLMVYSQSGRPYYPVCILAVDRTRGLILAAELTEPRVTAAERRDDVLNVFAKARQFPRYMWVPSAKTRELIRPIAERLGIEVVRGRTPMLNEAKDALIQRFV